MWHAFPGLPGGRYRRYLSLREGSVTEQIGAPKALVRMSPFPSPPDDSRSVLAVKGSLCRFAPWSACGPIRRDGCLRGKGGGRAVSGPKGTFRPSPGAEAIRGFRRRSFYLFFTTCICWRNGRRTVGLQCWRNGRGKLSRITQACGNRRFTRF